MSNKFQNEDFKTEAELVSAGGTKAQLLNDTKIYVTANGIAKTLDQAILDGDIGGSGGVGGVDIMATDTADKASLGQYTQVGLEILTSPVILHGTKSFRLIHQAASTRYFTKIIPVDRKFRGKLMTIEIDVVSTALSANLTLLVKNETTPGTPIQVAQQITTGSQTITATVTSTSLSMTGLSQADFNKLKLGQVITGTGIQSGTTITGLQPTTLSATLSLSATSTSTSTKTISALTTKRSFGFLMPEDCLSFSFTISALQEAGAPESYIDDIVIQLLASAMSSTTVTVPKNSDTEPALYNPAFGAGYGSLGNLKVFWWRDGAFLKGHGSATVGITTGGTGEISLPPVGNIDTAYYQSTQKNLVGSIRSIANAGGVGIGGSVFRLGFDGVDTTKLWLSSASNQDLAGGTFVKTGVASAFNTSDTINFDFEVKIAGWLANETETKTIPLTTAVLYNSADTSMTWQGFAGRASIRSSIPYFTNPREMVGSGFSWTTSTTNGLELTVLEDGYFDIDFNMTSGISQNFYFGIGLDLVDFTSALSSRLTDKTILKLVNSATSASIRDSASVSWSGPLKAGQKIYPMIEANSIGDVTGSCYFSVSKVGSLKILNPSKDQKIDIPTHEVTVSNSNSRGTGAEASTVYFSNLSTIKGDGFSVSNSNGTIITINKKMKVDISSTVAVLANHVVSILLNGIVVASNETASSDASAAYCNPKATLLVNPSDVIKILSTVNPSADTNNQIRIVGQEQNIQIALSNVLPQFTQSDSSISVNTQNGYGSTGTKIRRFSNIPTNLGSAATYIQDAVNGDYFLINEEGQYHLSYGDSFNGVSDIGISKNANVTLNLSALPAANVIASATTSVAGFGMTVSSPAYLIKGDVIRAHSQGTAFNGGLNSTFFNIAKIGKPNLTSVDVTPFVNIKTQDMQAIEALTITNTFGSTNTGVPVLNITKNTANGVIRVDSSAAAGTSFVALKACTLNITANTVSTTSAAIYLTRNSTILTTGTPTGDFSISGLGATNGSFNASGSITLNVGDVVRVQRNGAGITNICYVTLTATATSDSIVTPTQQISSDTLPFTFKATAIVDTDPIGTFNTYKHAASVSAYSLTICPTAPTQTISSMNVDGFRLFPTAYNAASSDASPSAVEIVIGKKLKAKEVSAFFNTGKSNILVTDLLIAGNLSHYGAQINYNETTGILRIEVGDSISAAINTRGLYDITGTTRTSAYFVFNASTSPSITALPILQPRIATLSDVKASGTAGGSSVVGIQTRVLNTIADPTGIVTSLTSNQFTLPRGVYYIEASAPALTVGSHKARLRNITDGTTSLIGSSCFSSSVSDYALTISIISGEVLINSPKVFEIQHYIQVAKASTGLGTNASSGESEVYSQVKITKIK